MSPHQNEEMLHSTRTVEGAITGKKLCVPNQEMYWDNPVFVLLFADRVNRCLFISMHTEASYKEPVCRSSSTG